MPTQEQRASVTAALCRTTVCRHVITRLRCGSASGVVFLMLEDETGAANVAVWRNIFGRHRGMIMGGRLLCIADMLQCQGIKPHLIVARIKDTSARLTVLGHPRQWPSARPSRKPVPRRRAAPPRAAPARAIHPRARA
ncbi:MAG: hypothetical protein Q4G26_13650 [Paracoccus sp. (in: a-proteobacteria)]|nr:hypothetical protein [Paracoccus sp. (in: a-proteobacteria)]